MATNQNIEKMKSGEYGDLEWTIAVAGIAIGQCEFENCETCPYAYHEKTSALGKCGYFLYLNRIDNFIESEKLKFNKN